MSNKPYIAILIIALMLLSAYPIYQLTDTNGFLFYRNAYDESTYLQYDFSRQAASLTRPGQYLVSIAHWLGLSGGWANFLFDLVALILFLLLTRQIFKRLDFDETKANSLSFIMAFMPLFFGGLNPVINKAFNYNLESGLVYWVTMPEAAFLPIIRSPEPQFSLILFLACLNLSLKWRSFIPAYLSLPFLYPFVALPISFVLITYHTYVRLPKLAKYSYLLPLASFLLVSLLLKAYFYTGNTDREILVSSFKPLLSITFLIAILIYLVARKSIPEKYRFFTLLVALSPLAATNHQILTGLITQPNNFEQYFGIYAIVLVVVMALHSKKIVFNKLLVALAMFLCIIFARNIFLDNYFSNKRIELSGDLLNALRTNASHVAINDVRLASDLNLVFPRQSPTALSYDQTFPLRADKAFKEYLSAKKAILANEQARSEFQDIIAALDEAYKYENKDFILIHINRKKNFALEHDATNIPADYEPSNLKIFTVKQ